MANNKFTRVAVDVQEEPEELVSLMDILAHTLMSEEENSPRQIEAQRWTGVGKTLANWMAGLGQKFFSRAHSGATLKDIETLIAQKATTEPWAKWASQVLTSLGNDNAAKLRFLKDTHFSYTPADAATGAAAQVKMSGGNVVNGIEMLGDRNVGNLPLIRNVVNFLLDSRPTAQLTEALSTPIMLRDVSGNSASQLGGLVKTYTLKDYLTNSTLQDPRSWTPIGSGLSTAQSSLENALNTAGPEAANQRSSILALRNFLIAKIAAPAVVGMAATGYAATQMPAPNFDTMPGGNPSYQVPASGDPGKAMQQLPQYAPGVNGYGGMTNSSGYGNLGGFGPSAPYSPPIYPSAVPDYLPSSGQDYNKLLKSDSNANVVVAQVSEAPMFDPSNLDKIPDIDSILSQVFSIFKNGGGDQSPVAQQEALKYLMNIDAQAKQSLPASYQGDK